MVKRKKRDNVPCLITWTHERKEIKVTKCYTRNRRRVTQGRGRKIEREDAPWRSRAGLESRCAPVVLLVVRGWHRSKACFTFQNVKCKKFINYLYGILNIVKK